MICRLYNNENHILDTLDKPKKDMINFTKEIEQYNKNYIKTKWYSNNEWDVLINGFTYKFRKS